MDREDILLKRIQQLKDRLEEIRREKKAAPRKKSNGRADPVLDFIQRNPGLLRQEIMLAQNIGAAVLTQLLKEGLIYTTEVENRFRRYYVR